MCIIAPVPRHCQQPPLLSIIRHSCTFQPAATATDHQQALGPGPLMAGAAALTVICHHYCLLPNNILHMHIAGVVDAVAPCVPQQQPAPPGCVLPPHSTSPKAAAAPPGPQPTRCPQTSCWSLPIVCAAAPLPSPNHPLTVHRLLQGKGCAAVPIVARSQVPCAVRSRVCSAAAAGCRATRCPGVYACRRILNGMCLLDLHPLHP